MKWSFLLTFVTYVILSCLNGLSSSTLFIPRLSSSQEEITGIAFFNPDSRTARLVLTAFMQDGSKYESPGFMNPTELHLPGGHQIARLPSELFGHDLPPGQRGWIQVDSSVEGVTGFFLSLKPDLSYLDGADLPVVSRSLVFESASFGPDSSCQLMVFNPSRNPSQADVTLNLPGFSTGSRSSTILIAPKGFYSLNLQSVFNVESSPPGSFVTIEAANPLGGFELVRPRSGDVFGLNALPRASMLKKLYFPQLAVLGPWETRLKLVNHSALATILKISAVQGDGSLFASPDVRENPVVEVLEGHSSLEGDVESMFGFSGERTFDGWIEVDSTSASVNGFISYGVPSSGSVAAVAAQSEGRQRAIFSHIATTFGYFTGIALLNPGSLNANFRLVAARTEGSVLGHFQGILRPKERLSRLVTELVPTASEQAGGFVWIESDLPIFLTALFGTSEVLANIPPQPVPIAFRPDDRPYSQVLPSLAVLPPSGHHQFAATGFTGPIEWSVDSIPGGSSTVGTVDSNGRYQAPSKIPSRRPVAVSARSGESVAVASVDILRKESLFGGLGVVQSIAYLSSQQRVYTAEASSSGATDSEDNSNPSSIPDTRLFATFPAPRQQIATFPQEIVPKLLPFYSSDGKEYLLVAAQTSGRILRLDPRSKSWHPVISGLSSPTAMTFDPDTGDLLVADGDTIRAFPRFQLEADITAKSSESLPMPKGVQALVGGFFGLVGLTVNACTGDFYVTTAQEEVIEVNRVTGQQRTLLEGHQATQLLPLYRTDVPCPAAFHLLTTVPSEERVYLLIPTTNVVTLWQTGTQTADLLLLPEQNPATPPVSVLLGETSTDGAQSGLLSLVPVEGLYSEAGDVPGLEQPAANLADPIGDTFGTGSIQYDILHVQPSPSEDELVISIEFAEPFTPATAYSENFELVALIELDIDQNPNTGFPSIMDAPGQHWAGLGVEYAVETEYDPESSTVPFYKVVGPGEGELESTIPITFEDRSLTIRIPVSLLLGDLRVNLAVEAGYYGESDAIITDVAPNLGHISTSSPP